MITVKNYKQEREKIDFSQLPDKYKKVDEFILEALDFYGEDSEIDKTIDKGIKQLNELHVSKAPDKVLSNDIHYEKNQEEITKIPSYIQVKDIHNDKIREILEKNKPYFEQIQAGLIGVSKIKFGTGAGLIFMETYAKDGRKGAKYYVHSDNQLSIKKPEPEFNIGESVNIIWGEDEGRSGVIEKVNFDEHLRDFIYIISGASKRIGQSNLEAGNGYRVVGKKNGQLVDISEQPFNTRDKARNWINEQGINNHYQNVDIIPSRGKAPAKAAPVKDIKNKNGKVLLDYIRIEWAEGDQSKYDKFPMDYLSWEAANKAVLPMLDKEAGYNKCKFEVMFRDGEDYKGRLDVSEKEDNPETTTNVFGDHIFEYLNWLVNDPKSKESEDGKKEIQKFLDTYDLGPGNRDKIKVDVIQEIKKNDIVINDLSGSLYKLIELKPGYFVVENAKEILSIPQIFKEQKIFRKATTEEIKDFRGTKIKRSDVKEGARFINPEGTIFIVDKISKDETGETAVESSYEGGKKGNYRNELGDFVDFMNEENCQIYSEAAPEPKKEPEEKKPTPEEVAAQKAEYKKEVEAELHKITSGGEMSLAQVVAEGRRINELRSFRSQFIDNGSDNKRRLTPTKENLARWINAPGRFDLIGVDTASKTDATADLKHVKKETIFHLIGINK
jgi:hypothetical protein